jgi:hypothetical protein
VKAKVAGTYWWANNLKKGEPSLREKQFMDELSVEARRIIHAKPICATLACRIVVLLYGEKIN